VPVGCAGSRAQREVLHTRLAARTWPNASRIWGCSLVGRAPPARVVVPSRPEGPRDNSRGRASEAPGSNSRPIPSPSGATESPMVPTATLHRCGASARCSVAPLGLIGRWRYPGASPEYGLAPGHSLLALRAGPVRGTGVAVPSQELSLLEGRPRG
jgi:hypothetical protein